MSELEDQINSILGDPEQMARISDLAKSLMGGPDAQEEQGGGIGQLAQSLMGEGSGFDGAALGRIGRLLSASNAGENNNKALLEAMKPYLSEKRRTKMDRAMRIAHLAKIAQLAMGELSDQGENGNV